MANVISIDIEGEKASDVETIVKVLQSFQKALYQIAQADSVTISKRGSILSKKERKNYVLKITNVNAGSFHAKMSMPVESEKIGSKTDMIINAIQKENTHTIEELLKNNYIRNRVLNSFEDMWSSSYASTSIKTPNINFTLDPSRREFIKKYIKSHRYGGFENKTFVGKLIGLEIEINEKVRLDSTEGVYFIETKKSNQDELLAKIRDHIGHVVRIEGRFSVGQNKLKVGDISDLIIKANYNHTEIEYYKRNNELKKLKMPLKLDISYDKETQKMIVENEELGLFARENQLWHAYSYLQDQFDELINQYAYESDHNLTKDGKEFKHKILKIIGE